MKKIIIVFTTCLLAACASDDAPSAASQNVYLRQKAESDCRSAYASMSAGFERDSKIAACVKNRTMYQ